MFVSHQFSMEGSNNGRRHGQLRNLLTTLTFGSLLAGCGVGIANEKTKEDPTSKEKAANNSIEVNTEQLTRNECLAYLPDKSKTKDCLSELNRQLDLENSAKKKELEHLNQTLEVLEKTKEAISEDVPPR